MAQPASEAMYARARQLIRHAARERNLTVSFNSTHGDEFAAINGDNMNVNVDNLMERLRFADPERWAALVDELFAVWETTEHDVSPRDYPLDKLFANIRTQLSIFAEEDEQYFNYAPELIPGTGLRYILALDSEDSVTFVTDEYVDSFDVNIDQLYKYAQKHTDAEPITSLIDYTPYLRSIGGDSFYISGKVANMRALIDAVIGEAPNGVIFGIPHRHIILYTVPTPENVLECINDIARGVSAYVDNPDVEKPGGLLGRHVYYWSPDDTYEILGFRETTEAGEPGDFVVVPSAEFMDRLQLAEE